MSWILFALLAPAIYAVVVFIDKYLVSSVVKNYISMPINMSIVGAIAGTLIWVFTGFKFLQTNDALVILLSGFLTAWASLAYYKALSFEEVSKITILFQLFPVITLILSFAFLKESLSFTQLIGFFLIFIATSIAAYERDTGRKWFASAFFFILIYDILWATSGILVKFAFNATTFTNVIVYESWGIGLGGISIYLSIRTVRKAFHENLAKMKKKAIGIIFLNESAFVLGKSINYYAFLLGPIALVSVLETTQLLFAILFGYILGILFPRIFHEDISRQGLAKKICAAFLVFIGILLLR